MVQQTGRVVVVFFSGWLALFGVGCASAPGPSSFLVDSDRYSEAFDLVRVDLTRLGFELERIDAQAGVIETRPKQTAGLATPWDTEQTTLGQEWEDFTNDQRRVVRVTFDEAGDEAGEGAGEALREVRVEVTLYRLRVPGRRIETESVRLSSRSIDELAGAQAGLFLTPIGRDVRLESRIAKRLRARVGG